MNKKLCLKILASVLVIGAFLAFAILQIHSNYIIYISSESVKYFAVNATHILSPTNSSIWADLPGELDRQYSKRHYFFNITAPEQLKEHGLGSLESIQATDAIIYENIEKISDIKQKEEEQNIDIRYNYSHSEPISVNSDENVTIPNICLFKRWRSLLEKTQWEKAIQAFYRHFHNLQDIVMWLAVKEIYKSDFSKFDKFWGYFKDIKGIQYHKMDRLWKDQQFGLNKPANLFFLEKYLIEAFNQDLAELPLDMQNYFHIKFTVSKDIAQRFLELFKRHSEFVIEARCPDGCTSKYLAFKQWAFGELLPKNEENIPFFDFTNGYLTLKEFIDFFLTELPQNYKAQFDIDYEELETHLHVIFTIQEDFEDSIFYYENMKSLFLAGFQTDPLFKDQDKSIVDLSAFSALADQWTCSKKEILYIFYKYFDYFVNNTFMSIKNESELKERNQFSQIAFYTSTQMKNTFHILSRSLYLFLVSKIAYPEFMKIDLEKCKESIGDILKKEEDPIKNTIQNFLCDKQNSKGLYNKSSFNLWMSFLLSPDKYSFAKLNSIMIKDIHINEFQKISSRLVKNGELIQIISNSEKKVFKFYSENCFGIGDLCSPKELFVYQWLESGITTYPIETTPPLPSAKSLTGYMIMLHSFLTEIGYPSSAIPEMKEAFELNHLHIDLGEQKAAVGLLSDSELFSFHYEFTALCSRKEEAPLHPYITYYFREIIIGPSMIHVSPQLLSQDKIHCSSNLVPETALSFAYPFLKGADIRLQTDSWLDPQFINPSITEFAHFNNYSTIDTGYRFDEEEELIYVDTYNVANYLRYFGSADLYTLQTQIAPNGKHVQYLQKPNGFQVNGTDEFIFMPKTNEVKSIVVDRYIEKPIPLYNISVSAEEFYQKMNIITSTYGVNLTRIEDHSSIIEHTYNTSDMTKFNTILTLGSEHLENECSQHKCIEIENKNTLPQDNFYLLEFYSGITLNSSSIYQVNLVIEKEDVLFNPEKTTIIPLILINNLLKQGDKNKLIDFFLFDKNAKNKSRAYKELFIFSFLIFFLILLQINIILHEVRIHKHEIFKEKNLENERLLSFLEMELRELDK